MATHEHQKSTSILKEKKIQKSIITFKYEKPKGIGWGRGKRGKELEFLGKEGSPMFPCPLINRLEVWDTRLTQ